MVNLGVNTTILLFVLNILWKFFFSIIKIISLIYLLSPKTCLKSTTFFSAFNEVADQPPTLKLPRGVTLNTETRRPGATKNLLLLDKLQGNKVNILPR